MQPYTFTAPNTPLGAVTTTQLARAIALLRPLRYPRRYHPR